MPCEKPQPNPPASLRASHLACVWYLSLAADHGFTANLCGVRTFSSRALAPAAIGTHPTTAKKTFFGCVEICLAPRRHQACSCTWCSSPTAHAKSLSGVSASPTVSTSPCSGTITVRASIFRGFRNAMGARRAKCLTFRARMRMSQDYNNSSSSVILQSVQNTVVLCADCRSHEIRSIGFSFFKLTEHFMRD